MTLLKKMVAVLLSFSLFFSVAMLEFSFNVSADKVQIAYVTGDKVNVRKTPSASGAEVDKISYRRVTVLGKTGDWLKVTYYKSGKKITGYIKNVSDWVVLSDYDPDLSFENQLKNFPSTYHKGLKELHSKYPNWVFIPENVNMTFAKAASLQSEAMRKQVLLDDQPISWRSMDKGSYDWDEGTWIDNNGGWTGASREIIKYYMDPRNFLDDKGIFMFLQQSYGDGEYTDAGLKKIVSGTFLNTASYREIILEAGKETGVSPYIIASKIIQEQGRKGTSSLISGKYTGYKGYYNFFNFGASGSTTEAVIRNGLKYAKEHGWNTKEKSIKGGAKLYAEGYIEVGQDTYYYQDFNVHFTDYLWHQYAQAIHDAYNKGSNLNETYTAFTNAQLVFRIPIYKSMPSKLSVKPASSSKRNNYYFNKISVKGLTPSFYRYTYEYDLAVSGDTEIKATVPKNASITSKSEFALKKGENTVKLVVKSQTGFTNTYTIKVNASKACTVYINKKPPNDGNSSSSDSSEPEEKVMKGDIDGDGKITINDIGRIRQHLLKRYLISNDKTAAADVDGDGNITINDIGRIRQHLLGRYLIK